MYINVTISMKIHFLLSFVKYNSFLIFLFIMESGGFIMKGQLSAEMLLLIVVILAVVAIVATHVLSSAREAGSQISEQSEDLYEKVDTGMKAREGEFCTEDDDCLSGRCSENYRCE